VGRYFSIVQSHWWILILSLVGLAYVAIETLVFGNVRNDLMLGGLMILAAWSYCLPYLVMLGHSEVRYVYPSNSLILSSIPFLISGVISRWKDERECNS
jgi:hypothetical protein